MLKKCSSVKKKDKKYSSIRILAFASVLDPDLVGSVIIWLHGSISTLDGFQYLDPDPKSLTMDPNHLINIS